MAVSRLMIDWRVLQAEEVTLKHFSCKASLESAHN